ncbi:MAG: trypsin-like peptidase domain-containing protein [Elusimicrobia bacterium]|nr:trypsin-like peptidase domain-containing protein [Elusimicrobiota bacterium]
MTKTPSPAKPFLNSTKAVSLAAALAAALPAGALADSAKTVYGADNRLDYYEAPADMQVLADSVVSLWKAKHVSVTGDKASLAHANFGEALNLCPSERFREQPLGAFCSGALVGEDMIMTAGHCVTDEAACADTKFVFGYAVKQSGGKAATTLPAGEVYGCKKIVKRDLDKPPSGFFGTVISVLANITNRMGPDYALIQLDRKVEGHRPLPVNRGAEPGNGTPLFTIGHPVGLPLKVAGGAAVRNDGPKSYYITDLDAFGGNSGGPVFNARTKMIEGILVLGGQDFVKSPAGCTIAYTVDQNKGIGTGVTRLRFLKDAIPEIPAGKYADVAVGVAVDASETRREAKDIPTVKFD